MLPEPGSSELVGTAYRDSSKRVRNQQLHVLDTVPEYITYYCYSIFTVQFYYDMFFVRSEVPCRTPG